MAIWGTRADSRASRGPLDHQAGASVSRLTPWLGHRLVSGVQFGRQVCSLLGRNCPGTRTSGRVPISAVP